MESADLSLRVATPDDAAELLRVIRAAFSARRPVDPPADALSDTVEDIARAIDAVLAAPGDPEPRLRRASEFSIARAVAAYDSLFDDVIGAADGRRRGGAASS